MAAKGSPFDGFLEKTWEEWYDSVKNGELSSDEEEPIHRQTGDSMRLQKEDMGIFGHCPERDPFYTVICEICNALVKPQGIRSHMEIWHRPRPPDIPAALPTPISKTMLNRRANSSKTGAGNKSGAGNVKLKASKPPLPTIFNSHPPSVTAAAAAPATPTPTPPMGAVPVTLALTVPASVPVQVPTPVHAAAAYVHDPNLGPPAASIAPTPDIIVETIPTVIEPAKISLRTRSPPPSHQNQQKKKPRVSRDREYDPNKHCGVWNPDTGRPCTRSLTCKSHSLSMRRAVQGRRTNFDRLLAEHRSAKEAMGRKGKPIRTLRVSAGAPGSMPVRSTARLKNQLQNVAPRPVVNQGNVSLPARSEENTIPSEMQVNNVDIPSETSNQIVITPTPPLSESSENVIRGTTTTTSKFPLIGNVKRFIPVINSKRQDETIVAYSRKAEDGSWITTVAPKPVAVISLTCRKQGAVKLSSRRPDQSRSGLQTALTEGPVRRPMTSEIYSIQLNNATNNVAPTIKSVLSNISAKPSLLNPNTLIINPTKNHHVPILPNTARKAPVAQSGANAFKNILTKCITSGAKPVPAPRPSLVKAGQFHMPNILSASLKRPPETYKTSAEAKRRRRNPPVNAVEVMTSILGKKPAVAPAFALTTTPLIKVTIPNGIAANCNPPHVVAAGSLFTTQPVCAEPPKPIMTVTTLPDVMKAAAVKGMAQNVRIAAPSSAIHVPASSITYLTTGPVTFQKIPVISPQKIVQNVHEDLEC